MPRLPRSPSPIGVVRGRGAVSNPPNRFEAPREAHDDGWNDSRATLEEPAPLPTEVFEERARSIIASNDSADVPFSRSINPYRGCEHGCIYCYARPGHGYLGWSPGLEFESKISVKVNAAECLGNEISVRGYRCEPIALGTATDAYQPLERRWRVTRGVVEVLHRHRHPFSVLTKSALIERDIDLLAPLARDGLVSVSLTLTTLDAELARRWEPRAAAPWRRLQTIRRLTEAGIPVGVSVAPVVPFLNEPEIERVLEAAREAGARWAWYSVLRLPFELRQLFIDWVNEHYPERASRVMHRVRDLRVKGNASRSEQRLVSRFSGEGPWAELIRLRFEMALRRFGYERERPALRTDLFRNDADNAQRALF
ncbi:MAG TPA: PA0069 family radical SAM protein [Zeimonas sp.]